MTPEFSEVLAKQEDLIESPNFSVKTQLKTCPLEFSIALIERQRILPSEYGCKTGCSAYDCAAWEGLSGYG